MEDIDISDCPRLIDLGGLENLKFVGCDFEVSYNERLTDISQIDSNIYIGSLYIEDNDSLEVCNEPWVCRHISSGRYFNIEDNGPSCLTGPTSFVSCACLYAILPIDITLSSQEDVNNFSSSFNSCPFPVENFQIEGEDIKSLDGLYLLDSIFGSLYIGYCDSLKRLDGLHNIAYIGEEFEIYENYILSDVSAIDTHVYIGDYLSIEDNDSLSTCDEPWICYFISCSDSYNVENNGPGCEEEGEGIQGCACIFGGLVFEVEL